MYSISLDYREPMSDTDAQEAFDNEQETITANLECRTADPERMERLVRQFAQMTSPEPRPLTHSTLKTFGSLMSDILKNVHVNVRERNASAADAPEVDVDPGICEREDVAMSGGEEDGELSAGISDDERKRRRGIFGDRIIDAEGGDTGESGDEGYHDAESETVGVGFTITAEEVAAQMAKDAAAAPKQSFGEFMETPAVVVPEGWKLDPQGRKCDKGHDKLISPAGHSKCRECASAGGKLGASVAAELRNTSPAAAASTVRDSVDPPETAPSESCPPEIDSPQIDAQIRRGMLSRTNENAGKFLIVRRDSITFWANKHVDGAEVVAEVYRDRDMKWRKRLPGSLAAGTIVLPV